MGRSDQFAGTGSVAVLLLSSTLVDAPLIRLDVEPTPENGLQRPTQIMVDKPMTVKRERIGEIFGHLDDAALVAVNRALAVFLGFA
ncbi:MAG: type II toxin-antitoxin system PemK/MazF family toxin [Ectothiorhodospira sp.]